MKNNIMRVLLSVSLMSIAFAASAQQQTPDNLDRQVDVSRDYTPDVDYAVKLGIRPDMSDTVALRPELDYTLSPKPWVTGFGVAALNPVTLSSQRNDHVYPFYIKAGGGIPGQTLLDLYATTRSYSGNVFGFSANHYGQYAKIKNDLGFKPKSQNTLNDFSVFTRTWLGRRFALDAELGYSYDSWSFYGQSLSQMAMVQPQNVDSETNAYSTPRGKLVLGHDFSDLSYFNIRFGAEGYYLSDKNDNSEKGVNAFFELGKMFSVHRVTFKGSFDGAFGDGDRKEASHKIITVGPDYSIETDKFKFSLGGDFVYSKHDNESGDGYFMPRLEVLVNPSSGTFMPFIRVESSLTDNCYYSLVKRNPYLAPDAWTHSDTREYKLKAGIKGTISNNVFYSLYAGGAIYKDPVYFYTNYDINSPSSDFYIVTDEKTKVFNIGGELEGNLSGRFSAGVSLNYYSYSLKQLEYAVGAPNFDLGFNLKYNYQDKFIARLHATLIGKRHFLEITDTTTELYLPIADRDVFYHYPKAKAALDVGLDLDYFFRKGRGIFISGRNLGNSKLYHFNHYKDQGLSVNAGVKLIF